MSFSNHAPVSETTPLLGDSQQPNQPSKTPSRESFRRIETLLIPVALGTTFASLFPSTTVIDVVRRIVCRIWNISHGDPGTFPAGDTLELCNAPEIERRFATTIAVLRVAEGVLAIAGCGILSWISSRYGRKPALVLVLVAGMMGNCLVSGSLHVSHWLVEWIFLLGMLSDRFAGATIVAYLVNMYIVDVCVPEDRTAALSKITGWIVLGTCMSFALGGFITTKTGNPLIVFYIAAAVFFVTFIYVASVLPESFPEEKRNALSRMRQGSTMAGPLATPLLIFEPLKILVPTRRPDGTRNWRLAWCAAHIFVYMTADSYVATAWLVLVTSKYGMTPADTGLFLAITSLSGAVALTLVVPPLVRVLRPYYRKRSIHPLIAEENARGDGDESEGQVSDDLDVHLTAVSCALAAIAYLGAAASTTSAGLIISGVCIGFSFIGGATLNSLVAASVDPLKQGEALAAVKTVSNAGTVLSPIVMGSILTATIDTMPLLLFYVHLVVMLLSNGLLFLVRDADRYRKPHEV